MRVLLQLFQDLFRKFVVEVRQITVEITVQVVNEGGIVLFGRLLNRKGI